MAKIEGVSLGELHQALDGASGTTETQRLMMAILYKQGPSVPMIADWFDVRAGTIYRWLDRIENEPLEAAIRDRSRPGRPPKLTDEQRDTFEQALREPPSERGYDASEWTPPVARTYLRDAFGVEYTTRHVRRLLTDVDNGNGTNG